jgi:HSP20 family protein
MEVNEMATRTELAPVKARELFPFEPFQTFRQRMNRVFEEAFGPLGAPGEEISLAGWTPSCDIYETDNEIVVKAELPEVKKEDVKVSIDGNTLEITGERKFAEETKRENYHRIERSYGQFMRSFTLPNSVDSTKIGAEFKEGILRVTLPKREGAKPKQIEVKVK